MILFMRVPGKGGQVLGDLTRDSAEGKGFEPLSPFGLTVFKTAAIDHSANLPEKQTGSCGTRMQR